jgi:sporulation protein YlmC with PRC-barrel domain
MNRQRVVLLGSVALVATALVACEATDRTLGTNLSGSAEPGVPVGTATTTQIPSEFRPMRTEELLGKDVYNSTGEKVGSIDEIVVNRSTRATAAVIGTGGFLGVGEKKIVVPFDRMRMQGGRVTAPGLTKETASTRQSYNAENWYHYESKRTLGELVR